MQTERDVSQSRADLAGAGAPTNPGVRWLHELDGVEVAAVGGKAFHLGRLTRAGFDVPQGFAISAEVFKAYVRESQLERPLAALFAEAATDGSESRAKALFKGGTWPGHLRAAIEGKYRELTARPGGTGAVAVRSSASAEDGQHASFAGQHTTRLDVREVDALWDAILECWASLYNSSALRYRRDSGVKEADAAMAVLVQAMVPATAAGVVFTVDPVSGDRDVVVINSAKGLGEALVSGQVTPDHFAVVKADLAIRQKELNASALSDEQAKSLAALALRIEKHYGSPQDVEWAWHEGKFWVLQSRPVTAAARRGEEQALSELDTRTDPETVWTATNVQEAMPGVISPLTLSLVTPEIDRYSKGPLQAMGIKLSAKDPFMGVFYGRGFLNVSLMRQIATQFPGGSADAVDVQFLGKTPDPNAKPPKPKLGQLARLPIILARASWNFWRLPAAIRALERTSDQCDQADRDGPFQNRPTEELIAISEAQREHVIAAGSAHVAVSNYANAMFPPVGVMTKKWLGDEAGALPPLLCGGLQNVESAQPNFGLWELSRLVLGSDTLKKAFAAGDGAAIARSLSSLEGSDVKKFREQLAAFLAQHGYRAVMEGEAAAPTWAEDLPTVYAMIRNYLGVDESKAPKAVEAQARAAREKTTAEVMAGLKAWQRQVFKGVLKQAQRWLVTREHTKSLMMRLMDRRRRVCRELARRLVEQRRLEKTADLYQFTWEEVAALARGTLDAKDAARILARRRAEEARNSALVLPDFFTGQPTPKASTPDLSPADGETLRGVPVCRGRVTGKARVILDPRIDAKIEPGEILVAPVTDAGWVPLFAAAAGLVVDVGGTLSHGATVAREYGLPAVVNAKGATRRIKTGDTITLDGSTGVVTLG